jgi:23S rRNA (cytidine1920-2'-O)/16S rRNA (cytidine1409-2'-O)-methyltransferase
MFAGRFNFMKLRADQLLVNKGLAADLRAAQALIMAGEVLSGTLRIDKPGTMLKDDAALALKNKEHDFVSRGGMKLSHGLDHFKIDPAGLTCIDIGSSTGGFTDVLLRRGAKHVYAVDAGFNQLDWALRNDARVTVMESTDARELTRAQVPNAPQLLVCDASLISLKAVLPVPMGLLDDGAKLVALIKPQFEVEKYQRGPDGIVRDPAVHQAVCDDITRWLKDEMKWNVLGLTQSPITGAEGNTEFLVAANKP